MLHLCTCGCLLTRPMQEDRGHRKCRVRLTKATWVNLTAPRYQSVPFLNRARRPPSLDRKLSASTPASPSARNRGWCEQQCIEGNRVGEQKAHHYPAEAYHDHRVSVAVRNFSARTADLNHLRTISEVTSPATTTAATNGRASVHVAFLQAEESLLDRTVRTIRFASPTKMAASLVKTARDLLPVRLLRASEWPRHLPFQSCRFL